MELKIFISSTYLDLKKYRDAVANALRKQGHNVIQMEYFAAREEEPTKVAKSELGKCDVVVGIYAHRYGFIPDTNDFSITEQEYWHAKSKDKPVFCFIVDEDQPWPPKMIESDIAKREKLRKFIEIIKKEKTVDFFTSPEDLAGHVSAAIGRYISEQEVGESSSASDTAPLNRPITSLPYLPYFFGREKELKQINEAISPETRTWGILIDGPGGIGKTALAIKAAQEASDSLFDRKIFLTAKTRELTSSGERQLDEYARINYLALLSELALELGESNIPRLNEEDRASALRRALAKQRVLIVFDNLETLDDDEASRLYQFLSLLPEGNKAIVTSRRRSDIDVRTIRLNRLNANEAKELINELSKTNSLLSEATQEERNFLYLYTGGNPLLIKWVAGQLGREGSSLRSIPQAINYMKQASRKNDPLEYIFGDLITSLYPPERLVLAALTHFGLVLIDNLNWISQMSEDEEDALLPSNSIESILDELSNRSILISNKKFSEYYLPEITIGYIRSKLPSEVNLTGQRLARYVARISREFVENKNFVEGQKRLEKEWPAILSSLPYFSKGRNADFQALCQHLGPFLKTSGRWDDWLWINQNAEKKALDCEDYYSAGFRSYDIALIYAHRGQSRQVLIFADRAKNYWSKLEPQKSPKETPLIGYLYGIAYKLDCNYEVAIISLNETLNRLRAAVGEDGRVADVLNALAEAQVDSQYLEEAETNLNQALKIAVKEEDKERHSIYKGNLAELALAQKNWAKAEDLAHEALRLSEILGQQEEIARNNYRIARALLMQGNRSLASSYALKSVNIYTRLRHKYLQEAVEVLMKCR